MTAVKAKPVVARKAASKSVAAKSIAAKPAAAKPAAAKPAAVAASARPKADKLVRDSFTLPKSDHQLLVALKQRSIQLARPAKKSEVVRAGIQLMAALDDKALLVALARVPALKTGRPKAK